MNYLVALPLGADYSSNAVGSFASASVVNTITNQAQLQQMLSQLNALQKNVPVIVAVTATWCGHCKQLVPVFEQVADQFASSNPNRVVFFNIETDKVDVQPLPKPFDKVQGFPTVYRLYKNKITPLGARDPASLWKFFNNL